MMYNSTLHRLLQALADDRIQAEIILAREIMDAFPELSRSDALRLASKKLDGEKS